MSRSAVCLLLTFGGACAQDDVTATTEQAVHHQNVTKIVVNGQFAEVLLVDNATSTNGGLTASHDEVAGTSALDFSWAFPDPSNADQVIMYQGAGNIPNSAFTTSLTTAHLHVTTPFQVTRCVINNTTGDSTCAPSTPITFDLTWTRNGVASTTEKTKRIETLGPVTTKFKGEFSSVTANTSGQWDTHTATNLSGTLLDTESTTTIREITMN
jgi:hypothetical protein